MGTLSRAKEYARWRYLLFFSDIALTLGLLIALFASGLSGLFKSIAWQVGGSFYGALLAYLLLFGLTMYIATLPLGFYAGYILEHRFDLSNQTVRSWAADAAKKALISFFITALLVEALYLFIRTSPGLWWVFATAGWFVFSVGFARVLPILIIPLFYRYKRLEDVALRSRILDLTYRAGVKVLDVFEIDFSAKTKKANAAFVGWGSSRRVILADNLVREFTPEEVEVVVAHEIAHYTHRDVWKHVGAGLVTTLAAFYLFHAFSAHIVASLGAEGMDDLRIVPVLTLLFTLFNLAALPALNSFSRLLEREADSESLALTNAKDAFISLMEKFAEKNLSDKEPPRAIEFLLYDHPSIARRIAFARAFNARSSA